MSEVKKRGNPNPSPATRFKKGNMMGGRTPLTPEQKALVLSNRTELKIVMTKYLTLSPSEIEELLNENSLPVIDIAILRNLKKMHEEGSMDRADWILDHIMGKQATKVEVKNTTPVDLSKLSTEELEHLKSIALKMEKND